MDLLPLVIEAISGAIGGNVAGSVIKDKSLGALGNTLAGIVGGGVGGKLLTMLLGGGAAAATGGVDLSTLIQQIAGGGIGGAILMVLAGVVKNMSKS